MKLKIPKLLLLSFCILSFYAKGQNIIQPITITMPATAQANTASWASSVPPIIITAQTKLQNGQVNGNVMESKILVTIKKGGSKICGSYTSQTAPSSNFNTASKTWTGANVLQLLGQDCVLSPGNYELCVQFYSMNSAQIELLGESCKPFTVADIKQENFSAPTNIFPENNKQFKENDLKAPITFRWTPIVPKPQGTVTYRLKVWQLMQGQSAAQAIRSNQPIISKDVDNITQLSINNLYDGSCKPPYSCDFAWAVEALGKDAAQGNSKSFGTSEPTFFGVNSAGCGTNTDSVTVKCGPIIQGKQTYAVTVSFRNIISSSGGLQCTTVMNSITSTTGVISALATLPVTIPIGGTSPTITFTYVPTVSNATTASFMYNGVWNDGFSNTSNFGSGAIVLPVCRCNTCDLVQWQTPDLIKYDTNWIKGTNNQLTLYGNIGFGPQKIIKLSTEIVDFYWYTEGDCKKCNSNDYYFGNLISGSAAGLTATSIADASGIPLSTSHQIDFVSPTLSGVSLNTPFALNISLPPQTQLSCCTDCFRFCIRYTATFMENGVCKTCTIVKCYETKRKHRKTGMQPKYLPNQCGDVTGPPKGEAAQMNGVK